MTPIQQAITLLQRVYRSAAQRFITLTLSGMLVALAVDVLIATKLGAGPETDALVVALSLPLFIEMVLRAGANFSLVPMLMERKASLEPAQFEHFTSSLLNLALAIGIGLALLIELGAPLVVALMAPGLAPETKVHCTVLLRLCGPMIVFALGIMVLSVLLNSWRRFSLTALRNAVTPAVVLMTLGFAWNRENITSWLAVANVVGFATFFLILLLGARSLGHRQRWSAWISREELSRLSQTVSLPTCGFFVRQSTRFVDRLLVSLLGPGAVASYYFGFRIFQALQTLIGYSIATTSLPSLSEHDLAGSKNKMTAAVRRNLLYTTMLAVPVVLFMLAFQDEIVRTLYGRGAFREESLQQTSQVLFWLTTGLLFAAMIPVLTSGLFAQRAYGKLFKNQVAASCVNIVLAVILSNLWGLKGIAVAASLASVFAVGNLLQFLHRSGIELVKGKHG